MMERLRGASWPALWRRRHAGGRVSAPLLHLQRLRLQLALWYAGILCCILLLAGAVTILAVQRISLSETDQALAIVAQAQQETGEHLMLGGSGPPRGDAGSPQIRVPASLSGIAVNAAPADEVSAPGVGEILLLVVDSAGHVAGNPRGVDEAGLPVAAGVQAAIYGQRDQRSVRLAGTPYRILTLPLDHGGAVQVGRSLAPTLTEERQIALVLLATGLAGLGLAVAGGLLTSGRALTPVREGIVRQRAFVADASHELRAPLTLIRANAETLTRTLRRRDDADLPLAQDIIEETDALARQVSDLLLLAQLDESGAGQAQEAVDLAMIAREGGRRITPLLHGRTLEVSTPPLEVLVEGDATALSRLLLILLDNAVRHTPPATAIRIRVQREGRQAELCVSDTGSGLSAEALAHVFDRYYRDDAARSRPGGAGLGLSIARAIAEASGGTLRLTSTAGRGLSACLRLPALA